MAKIEAQLDSVYNSTEAAFTTQTFSGEMFTESSMDIQSVTFPSHNYFGFDLGYDKTNNNLIGGKTYTAPQYNGNITGMVWKNAHDSKVRKYDYTYDAASRLTGANFGQYTASNFTATKVNYSVSGLTYDENGNIKKLVRSGLLTAGTSAAIDNLAYAYQAGSNKLSAVTDAILNNAGEKLGDFQDGNTSGADYSYDANGNMTIDKNKKITQ
ncbi:MAG TPA: hypothetical protein VL053_13280, partial [Arachidicoccus sp.]|nr:hypothetical protein [Arachidicoccus sp.]